MPVKQFDRYRKLQFVVFTVLALLLFVFATGEFVFRFVYVFPGPPYDSKITDSILGWRPKPYYSFSTTQFPDNSGGTYPVNLSFKNHGFRQWWSPTDSSESTILFIGDSFTESVECSDDNTFYNIAGKHFFDRVYAYGCSGYGTLQELMILQMYIDSVMPQYVVLEMCSNDFADNYWKLEEITGYKVGQRRPYRVLEGSIEYHQPRYFINDIRQYSKFLHFLLVKSRNALIKLNLISTSTKDDIAIVKQELKHPVYKKSYFITSRLLHQIKQVTDKKGAKLIVFLADNLQPTSMHLKEICLANDVALIDGVADSVYQHQIDGETVRAYDGHHWNDKGHSIVAAQLQSYFKRSLNQQ